MTLIDKKLLEEMWEKRYSHIYLDGWLNKKEYEYLVGILSEPHYYNKYSFISNRELVEAAKYGVKYDRPLEDTVEELKQKNKLRESL